MGRMEELVALLNKYAKEYYEQDNPTVSDAEYDALYDELVMLEQFDRLGLIEAVKTLFVFDLTEPLVGLAAHSASRGIGKDESAELLEHHTLGGTL